MPLFEYRCEKCGREFEELVRSTETRPNVTCPACQSRKVTKKFSTFGVSTTPTAPVCGTESACRSCPHASPRCGLE